MIARLKPTPVRCTDDDWMELARTANAKPDRVVMRRDTYNRLMECHHNHGARLPDLETTEQGKYVVVDRLKLFRFMGTHGGMCGKKVPPRIEQ